MSKGQPYELLLDGPSGPPAAPILPPQPAVERFRRKTSSSGVLMLTDVLPGVKAGAGKPAKLTAQAQLAASTQARQKDKFVPLPKALETTEDTTDESVSEVDEPARITVYCLAEGFQRKQLDILLARLYKGHTITKYSDVIQLSMTDGRVTQDAFFFDFGVVITFGLDKEQETTLLEQVVYNVQINAYSAEQMEVDNFRFIYSATEPPHIKNDCFTINKRQAKTHSVRLAIAHALAQSSKLSVYEAQVWTLAEDTKPLPEGLAQTGRVPASTKHVAQLIGRVFLQNANVNLLSSVLDTPDFFWSAPDHLQALYERACEYLELQARTEVINARFQVLQEMLDMLRSQQNNYHASRLEYIVIWLLVVDCILMLFQLLSLFGVIGGTW